MEPNFLGRGRAGPSTSHGPGVPSVPFLRETERWRVRLPQPRLRAFLCPTGTLSPQRQMRPWGASQAESGPRHTGPKRGGQQAASLQVALWVKGLPHGCLLGGTTEQMCHPHNGPRRPAIGGAWTISGHLCPLPGKGGCVSEPVSCSCQDTWPPPGSFQPQNASSPRLLTADRKCEIRSGVAGRSSLGGGPARLSQPLGAAVSLGSGRAPVVCLRPPLRPPSPCLELSPFSHEQACYRLSGPLSSSMT